MLQLKMAKTEMHVLKHTTILLSLNYIYLKLNFIYYIYSNYINIDISQSGSGFCSSLWLTEDRIPLQFENT